MMKAIKIQYDKSSVSITSEDICYSCFFNMYKTGDGHGIQVNKDMDEKKAWDMCNKIKEAIKEYENN